MSNEQSFETIGVEALAERVRGFREQGWRLVQIGATRLPGEVELTYSFDRKNELANLRVVLGGDAPTLPSISSIYWCAFLYENELHDLFHVQVSELAIDFQGHLYKTAVKFPFAVAKAPAPKPRPTAPAGPKPPQPAGATN